MEVITQPFKVSSLAAEFKARATVHIVSSDIMLALA
jgi:hypothetical protein